MPAHRNIGGKAPKYKCKEEIIGKIDAYFDWCEGQMLMNDKGEPVIDKWGQPIIYDKHPPTVTGLALALGFSSRTSLMYYQAKKEFADVITTAKSRVEQYTEERLFDKDGANGAKFSLQNNFKGWNEAVKEAASTATAAAVKIICDIPRTASPPQSADDGNDGAE